MYFSKLVTLSILSTIFVSAHPGEHHPVLSRAEIARRTAATQERHLLARKCSSAVASYTAERKAKRALKKRQTKRQDVSSDFTTATLSAFEPTISTIQNFTCVTAPDVTEGPYYINNEYVRSDLREDQTGVALELDIGVLDTVTCEPLAGVFIEIWSANATGSYGGFSAAESNSGTPGGSGSGNASISASGFMGAMPTDFPSDSMTGSVEAAPTGGAGDSSGAGGGMTSTALSDGNSWLRGGYPTNLDGMVGLTTIYPGFYTGRTVHVHVMVHSNWTVSDNGTIISKAGTIYHIGQFFFDNSWSDLVMNTTTYLANTNVRSLNDEDSIFAEENTDGNNAFVDLEMVGDSIEDGLLGYITMGVNTGSSLSITSTNYYNSTQFDED